MLQNEVHLGIDVGGTNIRIGVVDSTGQVLESIKFPSVEAGVSPEEKLAQIVLEAKKLVNGTYDIVSVGMGVPGSIDAEAGIVHFSANMNWEALDVLSGLKDAFKVPVYLTHDARAATLGEYYYGAAQGTTDCMCVTVGTGVGCGLIIHGETFDGVHKNAGEIGHTPVERDGLLCGCGRYGCLETVASGTGILNQYYRASQWAKPVNSTHAVFERAREGDRLAIQVIDNAVYHLSAVLIGMANTLSLGAIVISGGLSSEGPLFMEPLQAMFQAGVYPVLEGKIHVVKAALGEDAPLVGAASLHRYFKEKEARNVLE